MPAVPSSLALDNIANGASVLSAPLRDNFSDIQAAVNALIAILDGGSSGQVLTRGASDPDWAAASGVTYAAQTCGVQEIVSDATLQYILSQSLPGNTLGANSILRGQLVGDYFNNSGASRTLLLQAELGATPLVSKTSEAIPVNAVRAAVVIDFTLAALAATNSQYFTASVKVSRQGSGGTGIGNLGLISSTEDLISSVIGSNGPTAVDMTATQVFRIGIQHATSHASLSFKRFAWRFVVESV